MSQPRNLGHSMHQHRGTYIAEGVILVLLGAIAFLAPLIAGIFAAIFIGWLLLIAGVAGLVFSIRARSAPGFPWALISALIALAAGLAIIIHPVAGLLTLSLVLTAYFVADGIAMIVLALSHRRELSGRWEWILANGVIDLLLALFVLSGLPGTLVFLPGLLLGIDLALGGAALIAMALHTRA